MFLQKDDENTIKELMRNKEILRKIETKCMLVLRIRKRWLKLQKHIRRKKGLEKPIFTRHTDSNRDRRKHRVSYLTN